MLFAEQEKTSPKGFGFPPGCFILRSVSSKRLLDVTSHSLQDSAPIILWPEKDDSLIESKSLRVLAQESHQVKLTNA